MKIYELRVDDNLNEDLTPEELLDYTSVSEIALVENPAIMTEWVYFSSENFESYNDYPRAASDNACRAVKWAEENGWGSCGTQVGKIRATNFVIVKRLVLKQLLVWHLLKDIEEIRTPLMMKDVVV